MVRGIPWMLCGVLVACGDYDASMSSPVGLLESLCEQNSCWSEEGALDQWEFRSEFECGIEWNTVRVSDEVSDGGQTPACSSSVVSTVTGASGYAPDDAVKMTGLSSMGHCEGGLGSVSVGQSQVIAVRERDSDGYPTLLGIWDIDEDDEDGRRFRTAVRRCDDVE